MLRRVLAPQFEHYCRNTRKQTHSLHQTPPDFCAAPYIHKKHTNTTHLQRQHQEHQRHVPHVDDGYEASNHGHGADCARAQGRHTLLLQCCVCEDDGGGGGGVGQQRQEEEAQPHEQQAAADTHMWNTGARGRMGEQLRRRLPR